MLTALEIENFKGIAARQRIDFAPLTLLFGANSAGKSTILQALLYLHELIERGSADVDRTELGGSVLELGGFARLVHRHETNRSIVLRAEFATPGGLERFGRDLTDFPFPDLDDEIESAWLELTIRFRTAAMFRGPLIERAVFGVNGNLEPLVWLETGATLREGEPLQVRVNLGHPVLTDAAGNPQRALFPSDVYADDTETWKLIAIPEDVLNRALEGASSSYGESADADEGPGDGSGFGGALSQPVFALSRARASALPSWSDPIRVLPFGDIESDRAELASISRIPSSQVSKEMKATYEQLKDSIEARDRATAQVRTFLEMVVLGTTAQLAIFLREAIYIGPLRTLPPRGFLYERAGRVTSWADGLAAWDLLLSDRLTLVERTNHWLKRLATGCQVVVQQLFDRDADAEELSDGHVDKTVRRLLLDTGVGPLVLPAEVGAGISQILPVVVAAVEGRFGLTLVEQPEIHVHPAIQVGLGDLFIDAVTHEGSRRALLVETHSEHLILRILRRIRETHDQELPEGATAVRPEEIAVLHVRAGSDGVEVVRIPITADGEFESPWPEGFFAERAKELF